MHRDKWLGGFSVLALIGGLLFWAATWQVNWTKTQIQSPHPQQTTTPADPMPEPTTAHGHESTNTQLPATTIAAVSSDHPLLQEAAAGVFSDDPYLELLSLRAVLYPCSEPEKMTDFFDIYGTASQPQLAWQEQLPKSCEAYWQQYPHIMTTLNEPAWLADIEPTSALGQQIKQHSHIQDNAQRWAQKLDLIQQSLRLENSALLLRYSRQIDIMTVDPKDFAEVIQSQDRRHVWQVLELAIQVTACEYQAGMACAPEAGFMASNCAANDAACGLDFMSWYRNNTLPGIQQDVELMAGYLLEMSQ